MAENEREAAPEEPEVAEPDLRDRRDFLIGLGKWSKAVIGGVVLGGWLGMRKLLSRPPLASLRALA